MHSITICTTIKKVFSSTTNYSVIDNAIKQFESETGIDCMTYKIVTNTDKIRQIDGTTYIIPEQQ